MISASSSSFLIFAATVPEGPGTSGASTPLFSRSITLLMVGNPSLLKGPFRKGIRTRSESTVGDGRLARSGPFLAPQGEEIMGHRRAARVHHLVVRAEHAHV